MSSSLLRLLADARAGGSGIANVALVVLLVGAVAWGLVQTFRLWWRRASLRFRLAARGRRAFAGELRAESLLTARGYEVVGRQAVGGWAVLVDGAPVVVDLRADFIVREGTRRARHLVAEVKTGRWAPRIENAATRRQLLEYRAAFEVDGVLLVDVEAGVIHEIEFRLPVDRGARGGPSAPLAPHEGASALSWLILGGVFGASAALALIAWVGDLAR